MKLNCLVIDDEPAGRKLIEEYITETNFLVCVGSAASAQQAHLKMTELQVDLLFVDVQMPRVNGIEFLRSLTSKTMAILTTAHAEYAVQGFECDVIDYLLKPITFDRFLKAALKAKQFWESNLQSAGLTRLPYFFIKCNNKFEKINYSDLLFVSAANNYVIIQTTEKRLISYLTLKTVEGYLPAEEFIKVHKSYIVALHQIDNITGDKIKIREHEIPISRGLRKTVIERVVNINLFKR